MSLWLTHPLLLPSLIVGVTIVLWATSLLPEFITALLFFTAAMTARIDPPEVIFGGFASSAFWLVFSGFVLGVAIRKTGLADRAARALSAKLTDSWMLMVASVVLLSYALAFVMPSNHPAPQSPSCALLSLQHSRTSSLFSRSVTSLLMTPTRTTARTVHEPFSTSNFQTLPMPRSATYDSLTR